MLNPNAEMAIDMMAVEAILVYFMLKHGKDVGNMRKEFLITKADFDALDPKGIYGFGMYFEWNETTQRIDLRCVVGPKTQLMAEAATNMMKGSA